MYCHQELIRNFNIILFFIYIYLVLVNGKLVKYRLQKSIQTDRVSLVKCGKKHCNIIDILASDSHKILHYHIIVLN